MSELREYTFPFGDGPIEIENAIPDRFVFPEGIADAIERLVRAGFEVHYPNDRHTRNLNITGFGDSFSVQSPDGGCALFPAADEAASCFLDLAGCQREFDAKSRKVSTQSDPAA
jgi:hypothetical protein